MAARRPVRRLAVASVTALGSAAAAYYNLSPELHNPLDPLVLAGTGVVRSSRAIYTFAVNSLDYKYSLSWYDRKSEEYYEVRSLVHTRAAYRILKLCEANKGFYIKAGQFIASLQHMPKEYVTTLSTLQDKASPCPFEVVKKVLIDEFGEHFMDIYKEFDREPIAAASIAQVHHASLKNGQEVAVKVQYPMLDQQFRIDIATMDMLSRAVAWLFPDYQFQWIVPEFEKSSLKELDFSEEGHNAERTANIFRGNKSVKIPGILWNMTSHKVLSMEFMHGCKIDDLETLKRVGINPEKVAQVLVDVFAQMIFLHGYVHGDPHPGNILIDYFNGGKGQFQLVLLDHGLYRELNENFRSDFCHLWKALILTDPVEVQRIGQQLGAGKYFKYLPVIFTGRTLNSTSSIGEAMSPEERRELREEVKMLTFGDVSQFMEGLPRDLLIVLRTDGLLRSIVGKLGAQPRMRLMINARYAVSGLSFKIRGNGGNSGLLCLLKLRLEYLNLLLRLELLEIHYKIKGLYMSFSQRLQGFFNWINSLYLITQ